MPVLTPGCFADEKVEFEKTREELIEFEHGS